LDIAISDKQLLLLQAEKLSQEYTAPTGHSATALKCGTHVRRHYHEVSPCGIATFATHDKQRRVKGQPLIRYQSKGSLARETPAGVVIAGYLFLQYDVL